jgi:hypothetical protein
VFKQLSARAIETIEPRDGSKADAIENTGLGFTVMYGSSGLSCLWISPPELVLA